MIALENSPLLVIILFATLAGHVSSQEQQIVPAVRFSVPDKVEIDKVESIAKEALASISAIHSKNSDKSFQEGISLAVSEPDSVKKWVILQLLMSDAINALSPNNVMQVIAQLEESFDFPSHELAIQSLLRLEKMQKRPEDRLVTMGPLIAAARKAMDHSDFKAVATVCSYDVRRLPKSDQRKIQKFFTDFKIASNSRRKFEDNCSQARLVLTHMPDDEKANRLVALYECTLGSNLNDAIQYLSKSGNKDLQSIARLETSASKSAEEYKELADLWWALSNNVPESCRKRAILRAAKWYEESLASLNGLDLAVAKKRIETSLANDLLPITRLDLLRSDLRRSIKNGTMDEKHHRLHLGSSDPSYCQFFQPLNDNYDLEYKFNRDGGKWGFAFIFFHGNRPFMWHYSGSVDQAAGFAGFQGPVGPKNSSTSTIADRQSHTLLLRIRENRFEAILDGNLESDIRQPLESKPQGFIGHPAELSNTPNLCIVDWWGVTTVESATYTEYW